MSTNWRHQARRQNRFIRTTPTELADPLLKDWADWQRAARRAPATIDKRLRTLDKFARESGVSCVSACHDDLVAYFAAQHWTPATAATYFSTFNSWFVWLQRQGHRPDNPMLRMAKPSARRREPRPVSDADVVRMLSRVRHKTRVMILLAALAGLRAHEVAKVRGEDIDAARNLIYVDGKGGVLKSVPLHPVLASIAATMPASGFWFPGEKPGKHMTASSVTSTLGRVMRRVRVGGTPHSLRHYYGSTLHATGTDLLVIKELMRHANVATTQIYVKVPGQAQHEAVARLDPWAGARAQVLGNAKTVSQTPFTF